MAILAFDCCLRAVSVAVLVDDRSIVAVETMDSGQAERLLPLITSTLAQAQIGFHDLTRIAVTCGPGGFTSVRVGISAARGLALALSIPAVGQSSLKALAAAAVATISAAEREHATRVIAAIPAGKGGLYFQAFDASGQALADAEVVEAAGLAAVVVGVGDVLAGPGATTVYTDSFGGLAPLKVLPDLLPCVDTLARTAGDLSPVDLVRPIYLRPADARPQTGRALPRA